jgi:hypothetical protein
MDSIERRALYNLLRMNWLTDPTMAVEPWQIEDYRSLPTPILFERLKKFSIHLDKASFNGYADESDSPEDLTDILITDLQLKADQEDQVYLLVFELWRRLLTEKPSLSILCNELDHQIYLYDQGALANTTDLPDAINNFILILEENVDQGIPSKEAFKLISTYCANDLESFLYDFISDQIDEDNDSYVHDLLDDFSPFLSGNKWFELLRARFHGHSNLKNSHNIVSEIIENHLEEKDIEFNIELLAFLAETADSATFKNLIKKTIELIRTEEDFQDILHICADYCHRLDEEEEEKALNTVLQKRSQIPLEKPFDNANRDLDVLLNIFDVQLNQKSKS